MSMPLPARRSDSEPGAGPRRRRKPATGSTTSHPRSITAESTRQPRSGQPQSGAPRPARRRSRSGAPHPQQNPAAATLSLLPESTTDGAAEVTVSFAELGVPQRLLAPLAELGARTPFPIQAATLPTTLAGRDVLGRGRTGSGKTIAFAIPLVARLSGGTRRPHRPRGLVLLPTRELAPQVHRTIESLAKAAGLRSATVFGGVGFAAQTQALTRGVDILVACPGRLEDLIAQRICDLSQVEVTVLDEADHMADLGFLPGVRRLLRATPAGGQRLLFSATLDNEISVLVDEFLTDPAVHAVDGETSPVHTMTHHLFTVDKADRSQVIRQLASGAGKRLLFTRTKYGAKKLAATLTKGGIPAVDLHGNLAQNARERNLAAFASGAANVLVATDIAARGIHVDEVELVVHVDPPAEHKAYLHRSGRTARAGAGGTVVTLMLPESADDVRKLFKQAGITPRTATVRPGDAAITALTS